MKEGWEYRIFESCLVKVPKQVQVKSKDYKKEGKYPSFLVYIILIQLIFLYI